MKLEALKKRMEKFAISCVFNAHFHDPYFDVDVIAAVNKILIRNSIFPGDNILCAHNYIWIYGAWFPTDYKIREELINT